MTPSQSYISSLLALAAVATAAAVPSQPKLNRIAATGWGSGAQASYADLSSGVRVYAVDETKQCLQEWVDEGERPAASAPNYRRAACLTMNEFGIDLNSAFSATSLEQSGRLAELRVFYWTEGSSPRIGSASWAPGRSSWLQDAQLPKKVGGGVHKSKLTATVAKTSETTSSKSVFYMANGIIKELSQDGNSDSQWQKSPKKLAVKGKAFDIPTNQEIKDHVDIQAVSYVVSGTVYKKVYLLSKKSNILYEIDWNTDQPTYKPVMTSIASFTAASMYTNDVPGIRLYYTEKGKTVVQELWNTGTITGPQVNWDNKNNRVQVSRVDVTFAAPLAAAYQYQANNNQGWMSVVYMANPAEPLEIHGTHRAPSGEWAMTDYRLP